MKRLIEAKVVEKKETEIAFTELFSLYMLTLIEDDPQSLDTLDGCRTTIERYHPILKYLSGDEIRDVMLLLAFSMETQGSHYVA